MKRRLKRQGGVGLSAGGQRFGFTMLELTVACGVLGMVFLVTIPVLVKVRETREHARQRFVAQQEAANVMERLAHHAAAGTLREALAQTIAVSPEAQVVLPEVQVNATGVSNDDEAMLARVTVAVSWADPLGQRTSPVSLEAWLPLGEQP